MKKIKKFFLTISFVLPFVSCSMEISEQDIYHVRDAAEQPYLVTMDEARTSLESILSSLSSASTKGGDTFRQRKIVEGYSTQPHVTVKSDGEPEPYAYVFNFADSAGFAIMSSDSRVPPLLALVPEGTMSEDSVVTDPGMSIFLERLPDYIPPRYDPTPDYNGDCIPAVDKVKDRTETVESRIYYGGDCKVKWDQVPPYNDLCPIIGTDHALTGCVATAVGQLMSLYEYPAAYNGYVFDWFYINDAESPDDDIDKEQVARLMEQLGLSHNLDMDYGLIESGADPENIPRTLRNFGYSNGGNHIDYNTETIVSELKNGYPVLVIGYAIKEETYFCGIKIRTNYSDGHCWLAHGLLELKYTIKTFKDNVHVGTRYEYYYYPLCNFGWGGTSDGYYLSGVFDARKEAGPEYEWDGPSSKSGEKYNYQYNITAVTGIRK